MHICDPSSGSGSGSGSIHGASPRRATVTRPTDDRQEHACQVGATATKAGSGFVRAVVCIGAQQLRARADRSHFWLWLGGRMMTLSAFQRGGLDSLKAPPWCW